MPDAPIVQVIIAEADADVAQSVSRLAIEVFPHDAEVLIGKTTSVAGAKRLLDRIRQEGPEGVAIVVCATQLSDGTGLDVLNYARRNHPTARIVLLTSGERDQIVMGLTTGADGIVAKPFALKPLRAILDYLAHDSPRAPAAPPHGRLEPTVSIERVEFQGALAAFEAALEAVERAQERLARTTGTQADISRRTLREVEFLAIEAHRRFLEAEKQLAHRL